MRRRLETLLTVLAAMSLAAAIMARYHNVHWFARDEGNYAQVAERILAGEVLHRDVQDIHPGYIDFVNAAAFRIFGVRLASMRYPLAVVTVVQAGLVAWVLSGQGVVTALAGALLSVALGVLLFLNPSANWYGLALAICLIALLHRRPWGMRRRAFVAGLLVGIALMFRQLTGAVLGVAALNWLLTAEPEAGPVDQSPPFLARIVLFLAFASTLLYLGWATDGVGWLLFGAGPFLLGAAGILGTRVSNSASITRLSMFLLGVVVGVLPMMGYVILSGAWGGFVENTVFAAVGLPGMGHFEGRSYATYLALSILGIATLQPSQALGGAFWLTLIVLPLLLSVLVARRTRPREIGATDGGVQVAVFTGLLMAHYPSVFYVGIAAPAVLLGLLLRLRPTPIVVAAAACLAFVHVIGWGIGTPRGTQWVFGARREFESMYVGGRVGLVVPEHEWRVYERVIEAIKCRSEPHDAIFVAPSHAELYFLAARRNPTPFFSFGHGVRSTEALQRLIRGFQASPPRVVIVDTSDPEFTPFATEFLRWTETHAIRETRFGAIRLFEMTTTGSQRTGKECDQAGRATAD